ncbi:MAG: glycosyltransferase family 2 protein [Anaerolineales bacterium]
MSTLSIGLSVVLPVYHEQDTIGALVDEIVGTLDSSGMGYEVIAVDDGSTDGTLAELRQLRERHGDKLHVARHLYNKGNGAALRTGLGIASGEVVVFMDADGQHSPEDIPRLISQIPPYDLVIGARTSTYRGGRLRGLANRLFNWFASWLSRKEVKDLTSGFRAMRRSAAQHFLPLFPDGFSAPTTTTLGFLKAGYNVAFVPIDVRPRSAGKSKIRLWSDGLEFLTLMLRIVALYDPLRIFVPTGIVLALLGTAAWVAGMARAARLVLPNSAVLLFLVAIVTWLLGLISSQVATSLVPYRGDESLLLDEEAFADIERVEEGTAD